ncbi:tRNA-queuosine alpha-mannosyltransferase domain-containing protein [Methylohalobius crimeensis]|uniref:tRNA-queuosine alpha-mannosyltransferase domain-containing protein n=1 Tax=Methylohalobius crimeensis TaxID=244365 RepID=UPI0003B53D04|nr:DUF3524 domain-containing protein [Methylohalobius crimeensis]
MIDPSQSRILVLSAYDAASHRRWREQLIAALPHYEWHVLSLPPRFFRWRIRGNPLSWLDEPLLQECWDLIVASSMVDLASLRGFHPNLARVPALLYMHENQFAFPVSEGQHWSAEPQMVNLYSAVAADRVVFNSRWNRMSFLSGVDEFLSRLPDGVPPGLVDALQAKSDVVPVPIEDRLFVKRTSPLNRKCPHLLWNHRWEYDKGPDRLLHLLDRLADLGQPFRLSVVGERFRKQPEAFEKIGARYAEHIAHFGFIADRARYERLLVEADVVISTALHDFQGLSLLEAMASDCIPLAPDRLAYPEYVPSPYLYPSYEDDAEKEADAAARCLHDILASSGQCEPPDEWRVSRVRYDRIIRALLESSGSSAAHPRKIG